MIDTHAHAFPGVAAQAAGVLEGRDGSAAALAAGSARALGDVVARTVNRLAPSRNLLEIGTVATLERVLPERGFGLVEQVSGLATLPPALLGGTVDGLLASMSRHGVERTVLIGARGPAPNRWLLDEAWPKAPDRLVPVATLPELSRAEATLDEWVEAYDALALAGAAGFKIHPNWDGVMPGHPSYDAAFEVASERGRFVIVHTGCFHVRSYREREPIRLRELRPYLERHPDVRVCLAHMNRAHPEAVWELQHDYEQVYTDTSWQPARVVRRAIEAVGSERLMLGSDWPLLHLGLQRDAIRTAERAASGRHLENVVSEAPRRFIGDAS